MKRVIYLLPIFLFPIFINSCDVEKGACVTNYGPGGECVDDFTYNDCDMVHGIFHEGKSCADLGFAAVQGNQRSIDSTEYVNQVVIVDSCEFDNYLSK